MSTRKTKEEKERLIADYKASGLSISKWCNAHNISNSTFSGWLHKKKNKNYVSRSDSKARFVEIIVSEETKSINTADITIELRFLFQLMRSLKHLKTF